MLRPSLWRFTTLALAALLLTGCASVINPYVAPEANAFRGAPGLDTAVSYAEDTREAYYTAIIEHTQFNRSAGVALIGAAAAAAVLGVTDGSTSTIAALAGGGAALYTANSFLFKRPRLAVYVEGAKAVSCTLAAFAPVRAADPAELRELLATLDGQLEALATALEVVETGHAAAVREARAIRGRRVLAEGRAARLRGREANAAMSTAGVRLYDAVQTIRGEVYKALLASEPDVGELVRTLGKSIPANAGLLVPGALPGLPAASRETGVKLSLRSEAEAALARVDRHASDVIQTSAALDTLLSIIGAAPGADTIAACGIDAEAAGLGFRLDPSSQVFIDTSVEDPSADIMVSGGRGPYHARWLGQRRDLPDPSVDHDVGGGGRAVVTVSVPQGTPPESVRLLVYDEGAAGQGTLLVTLERGGVAAQGATPAVAGTGTPPDPEVEDIQIALAALGCLAPKRANGSSNLDGHWGEITQGALERLLAAIGTPTDDFAAVAGAASLGAAADGKVFKKAVNDQIASARSTNRNCP